MSEPAIGSRFAAADDSPGLLLWRVTNRWQAAMRAALAPHGLTHVQYVLLATLCWLAEHEHRPTITQTHLAEAAVTDPMMTSQVLRALEAKGWIEREPDPTDRRARLLAPTREGSVVATAATHDVEAADAAFFGILPDAAGFARTLGALGGATR